MELATQADVEARLGRTLTEAEEARLPGLLEEASVIVADYYGCPIDPDDIPDKIVIVVSRMVARVLQAPADSDGIESTQMSAGSFQVTRNFSNRGEGGGPWLTRADKKLLGGGMVSVSLGSERS